MSAFFHSLRQVFQHPLYVILAFVVAGLVLVTAIWLPNLHLITKTIHSQSLSVIQKSNLLISLLGGLDTNFTPLSRRVTMLISILFGVNSSMLLFYFKERFILEKSAGVSAGGMVMGLLGVGCASCGSVILSTLFGLSTTVSFLGILPLRGQEFGIVGITLLSTSIYIISKKIENPLSCNVTKKRQTNNYLGDKS